MARGKSGRIVLEINPELKRKLYLSLERKQLTLKDWFIQNANIFIESSMQLDLFIEEDNISYQSEE